jgi:hypothetical protein
MSSLDFYRKLIKPIRNSYIDNLINTIDSAVYSPYDKELTWDERIAPISTLKHKFLDWSKDWVTGLDQFPYMYVMNGNTDSLNTIFSNTQDGMSWQKGDYSYYNYWHTIQRKSYKELTAPEAVSNVVVSWPGYSWGNRDQLEFAKQCNANTMHLDCAYLGLVKPDCIDAGIFDTASFSFSKTLSIPYNRISLLFSKKEIPSLVIMNKLGYVNLSGVKLATHLLNNVAPTYWWDTYSSKLDDLCLKNNLRKTDCILFAYNGDQRVSLAEYWKEYETIL